MQNQRSKPPSILFVAPSAYPLGGVAVWLGYLLNGLSHVGFDIHLGMLSGKYHQVQTYLKQHDIDAQNVNIIEIDAKTATRESKVNAVMSAIQASDADIVVSVNAPDSFEACNRLKNTWKPTLKTVMSLHALEPDYFKDIQSNSEQIDAVIVTNHLTLKMVSQFSGFDENRVFYAPYGVEIPVKDVKETKQLQKPLRLLLAGRIENEQKRIHDVIDLVKLLEADNMDYSLTLAGDGPETDNLVSGLNKLVQQGEFDYLGNVNQEELFNNAFKKSDVLLLFSQWETGPIIIWEAMAHQLAIISSQYVGAVSEAALKDGENAFLFPIGDIGKAKLALDKLSAKNVFSTLIDNGYQLVEQRYSRPQSIKQWSQALSLVFSEIASKKSTKNRINWSKDGIIETLFGHNVGNRIRQWLNKPALVTSAGSEWSHSLTTASNKEADVFFEMLNRIESKEG